MVEGPEDFIPSIHVRFKPPSHLRCAHSPASQRPTNRFCRYIGGERARVRDGGDGRRERILLPRHVHSVHQAYSSCAGETCLQIVQPYNRFRELRGITQGRRSYLLQCLRNRGYLRGYFTENIYCFGLEAVGPNHKSIRNERSEQMTRTQSCF